MRRPTVKQTVAGEADRPHRSPAAAHAPARASVADPVVFTDNRPEAITQRSLADAVHHSPVMMAQRQQLRGAFGQAGVDVAQRVVSRGSGTGWGFPFWVEGGEALWKRIDTGFNTDLPSRQSQLAALVGATHPVVTEIAKFVKAWDNRIIYFKANPGAGQHQSAAEFANAIGTLIETADAAIEQANTPVVETMPPQEPPGEETSSADTPTPKALARKPKKRAQRSAQVETPQPLETPLRAEPEPLVDTTTQPAVVTAEQSESAPKTSGPKGPKKMGAAEKAAAKRALKAQQAEADRLKQEKASREAAERKARLATNKKQVEEFGARLKAATNRTVNAERISLMPYWLSDIDPLLTKAVQQAQSGVEVRKATQRLYDTWSVVVNEKRAANARQKQGSQTDWQVWSGLDNYRVIDGLPDARFTPALPPVQGPALPDGTLPVAPMADTIDIHVTYDRQSVGEPRQSIQGQSAAQVTDMILSRPDDWQRIHATLEANAQDNPHVYWGGTDLGLGAARYHQWNQPVPPGWIIGPEGPSARAKVQQVLNDFVNAEVVTNVQLHLKSLQFTDTPLPEFDKV